MEKSRVDALIAEQNTEEAVEKMTRAIEEEYDEYTMLKLAELCAEKGDVKEAKKIVRKLQRLFPAGNYIVETERLRKNLQEGNTTGLLRISDERQEKGLVGSLKNSGKQKEKKKIPENIQECFAGTIGMEPVERELEKFYKVLLLQNDRKKKDFQPDLLKTTHFAVIGERGSGKTLVGNIIAKLLWSFGIRSKDSAVIIEAREILHAYDNDGDAGIKGLFSSLSDVTVIVENIQDIILERDFVPLRPIALCMEKIMRNKRSEISIILTGNRQAKTSFFEADKTLEDCLYSIIEIPFYSAMDLFDIAEKLAGERALRIHPDARKYLLHKIKMDYCNSDFMNTIALGRYIDEATNKMAERYASTIDASGADLSEADMVYLRPEDFDTEVEEESLEELLAELDAMTGLSSVKAQIRKRIEAVNIANEAREAGAAREENSSSLHMLFTGNPGTGKTTVARLLGRIYQYLGVLPRGNCMVECTRSDLVEKYVGHTAKNVSQKVKEAMGGILFIDEAYALYQGDRDIFGKEAVDELIAAMENNRQNMLVILAGYTEEMEEFLKVNPGFRSRIRNTIVFEDYNTEEMVEIFKQMIKKTKMRLDEETEEILHQLMETSSKTPDFGNARGVRNLVENIIEAQNARLTELNRQGETVTAEQYETICKEDLQEVLGKEIRKEKSLEELLAELDGMIGLASVKEQVKKRVDAIKVANRAKEAGAVREEGVASLHMLFTGNPGTGKTTMARLIGEIYRKLGVLPRGNCTVECTRSDLVAEYVGQTAKKVKRKMKEAMGGVLFIDEAYALCQNEGDSFGREAVDELIAGMENNRENMMVILAGYSEEMKEFLKMNPGFRSRIRNTVEFEDYSTEEMVEIFKKMIEGSNMHLDEGTDEILYQLIETRSKAPDFGNARGVRNLVDDVKEAQNTRLIEMEGLEGEITAEQYETICREDLEKVLGEKIAGEKTLDALMDELEALTGLESVKKKVREMVNDIKVKKYMKDQGWGDVAAHGSLHLVFKGNAGTGKTTIARLIGQIYKELGVLQKNVFVETGRKDFVADYMGQTASKTMKKIKEADGGVLFIDEAYNLANGERDEFGREAVNTLLAEMENRRDNIMVVVAGYPDEMDKFLDANQGLASRLSNEIIFEDYSLEELQSIFEYMVSSKGMLLASGLEDDIKEIIRKRKASVKDFGNARGVRNIVEDLEKKKNSRVANMLSKGQLSQEDVRTLVKEDFEELDKEYSVK